MRSFAWAARFGGAIAIPLLGALLIGCGAAQALAAQPQWLPLPVHQRRH